VSAYAGQQHPTFHPHTSHPTTHPQPTHVAIVEKYQELNESFTDK